MLSHDPSRPAKGLSLAALLALAAVGLFVVAGVLMLRIHSEASLTGDESIIEEFMHAVGFFSFGMAAYVAWRLATFGGREESGKTAGE